MTIESPEQPQNHKNNGMSPTPYDGNGETIAEIPGEYLSADAHPGARLAPDAGQEIPPHNFDNTPLGVAHDPETVIIPDSPAILAPERRPFWTRGKKKIGASVTAVLAVVGGGGIAASTMSGHGKAKATSTSALNPGNTAPNGATNPTPTVENKPTTLPPSGVEKPSTSSVVNLTSISKGELTLTNQENPGDKLPAVPVYLEDPAKNPAACMDAVLANLSYALSTTDENYVAYSIDNLTDQTGPRSQIADARTFWQTYHPGKLFWFWSDGPVSWKVKENSDGSVTVSLASGKIYFDALPGDPDAEGWTAPEHPATSEHSTDVLAATFKSWETGNQLAKELGYRGNITGMMTNNPLAPIPGTLLLPQVPQTPTQ